MKNLQENITKYNELRKYEGQQAADEFATALIYVPGSNTIERGKLWDLFKAELKQEQAAAKKAENREINKARRERAALKCNLKALANEILLKNVHTGKAVNFLESIKIKRKLTVKQYNWLVDLADIASVEIKGIIDIKERQVPKNDKFAYSESEAYRRFDIPVYDEKAGVWYDAEC